MRVRPLACALLVTAGCGGHSEADAVDRAVEAWIGAVVDHDSRAACARLSTGLRTAINRHIIGEGVTGDCRTWAARWVSPAHPASRRDAHVTSTRVEGHRATVRLVAPGHSDADVRLVKEDGSWRIDNY